LSKRRARKAQIVKKTKTKKLLFSKNKEEVTFKKSKRKSYFQKKKGEVIFKNHEKAGKSKAREMRMKKLRLSITRSLGGLFGKVYSS
jgi:hypothetical protein